MTTICPKCGKKVNQDKESWMWIKEKEKHYHLECGIEIIKEEKLCKIT